MHFEKKILLNVEFCNLDFYLFFSFYYCISVDGFLRLKGHRSGPLAPPVGDQANGKRETPPQRSV